MYFRIKEARKAAKLTQKQLAEKLGIKVSTLSGYEIGAHDPKSNTLAEIAKICNTTVDYLLAVDVSAFVEDEKEQPDHDVELSDREAEFMSLYLRLDAEGVDLIDCYLKLPSDRRHLLAVTARAFLQDG